MQIKLNLAAALVLLSGAAQANDGLIRLAADDRNWVMQTKDYAATHYSKLSQINTENVRHLQVACLIDRVAQIGERQTALASVELWPALASLALVALLGGYLWHRSGLSTPNLLGVRRGRFRLRPGKQES